jgi:hypothetical protein
VFGIWLPLFASVLFIYEIRLRPRRVIWSDAFFGLMSVWNHIHRLNDLLKTTQDVSLNQLKL